MTWRLFTPRIEKIPAAATDEAGPLRFFLQPDDNVLWWKNFLKDPTMPTLVEIAPPPSTLQRAAVWGGWLAVALLAVLTVRGASRAARGSTPWLRVVVPAILLLVVAIFSVLGLIGLVAAQRFDIPNPFAPAPAPTVTTEPSPTATPPGRRWARDWRPSAPPTPSCCLCLVVVSRWASRWLARTGCWRSSTSCWHPCRRPNGVPASPSARSTRPPDARCRVWATSSLPNSNPRTMKSRPQNPRPDVRARPNPVAVGAAAAEHDHRQAAIELGRRAL